MKKNLLTFVFIAICLNGMSQFQHSFGTLSKEIGQSVQLTSGDAGYIVAGVTSETIIGSGDATLVKTDPNGIITWSKVYGGEKSDMFTCVRQLPASTGLATYVAVGQTYSFGFGGSDVYFVLTDAAGMPLVSRVYGGPGFDKAYCVQNVKLPTGAPGFVIVGETNSFTSLPGTNVYVILTDQAGNLLRAAVLGYTGDDRGYWIEQTSDGGFILVGSTTYQCGIISTTVAPSQDIYVVKLDNGLNLIWDRIIGGGPNLLDRHDIAFSVKENPYDRSIVVTGRTHSFSSNTSGEAYLLNLSSAGIFNYLLTYGLENQEEGHSLLISRTLNDVDYVVAGYTTSIPYNNVVNSQALLFKTNSSGIPYWARVYGLDGSEAAMEVHYAKMPNLPGYVFTGYETSFGAGSADIYLVEADANGKTGSPCEKEIELKINKHEPCISRATKIFYVTPALRVDNIYKDVDYKTNKCSIFGPVAESTAKSEAAGNTLAGDHIIVTPNPANAEISVRHQGYQNSTMRIVNLQGRPVSDTKIAEGEKTQFSISNLPNGLYLLEVKKDGNKPEFYKILKQ